MKQSLIVVFFCVLMTSAPLPQNAATNRVSNAEAQQILKSLIPAKKHFVVLNAYILLNAFKNEKAGSGCSSHSSGSITPSPGSDGGADVNLNGSADCSDLYTHNRLLTFAIPDPHDPKNAVIVILTASYAEGPTKKQKAIAAATLGWGALFMHFQGSGKLNPGVAAAQPKTYHPVVLAEGKHGTFDVYLAESKRVGAKPKVTKFAVIELERVTTPPSASKK